MDFDRMMKEVREQVRQESEQDGQLTLGAFIEALEKMPQDVMCVFESGGSPAKPRSYRGYYEQLAFGATDPRIVAEVLADAKSAMGARFEGYKGGDFWMTGNTMIWAASYGNCGDRIVGVSFNGDRAIVATAPDSDP